MIEERMRPAANEAVRKCIAAEGVALVGGELAVFGAVRVINLMIATASASAAADAGAAAAGSSGTGATVSGISGWWTLGIGVAAGVVIDYGVSRFAGNRMVNRLNDKIDNLRKVVIEREGESAGLKEILVRFLALYREQKHSAVYSALRDPLTGGERLTRL